MMKSINDIDWRAISAAIFKQNELDYEDAGPKAPYETILYRGVTLSSRHNVIGEFDEMRRVIDSIPELLARRIDNIWCDSKANSYFVVTISPEKFLGSLPDIIFEAFRHNGAFNGVEVNCPPKFSVIADPWWPGVSEE